MISDIAKEMYQTIIQLADTSKLNQQSLALLVDRIKQFDIYLNSISEGEISHPLLKSNVVRYGLGTAPNNVHQYHLLQNPMDQ